jgi:2-polyprenyl-6-methoxyphenol hydroxylase-like FAD-dependent oxidoreductase
MNIAIVGAGPAGLIAALAARKCGFEVVVFEQAPDFKRIGGGILIHSNGLRVFDALGVLGGFEPAMRPIQRLRAIVPPARIVGEVDYAALPIAQNRCAVTMRYELQEYLLACAQGAGIEVRFGHRLGGLDRREHGAVLRFDGDGAHEAAIVLACDGINSVARETAGLAGRNHPIGEAYLRAIAQRATDAEVIRELWGADGRRFGICPMTHGRTYIFCSVALGRWDAIRAGGLGEWIESWRPFGAEVVELLRAVPDWDRVSYDELHELRLDRWFAPPVFVIGDAAHAMTPNLGQGANCAMVDALVVVRLLAEARDRGQTIEQAGARYESIRKRFVTRIQTTARQMGAAAAYVSPAARAIRNAILSGLGRAKPLMRRSALLGAGYNPAENEFLTRM